MTPPPGRSGGHSVGHDDRGFHRETVLRGICSIHFTLTRLVMADRHSQRFMWRCSSLLLALMEHRRPAVRCRTITPAQSPAKAIVLPSMAIGLNRAAKPLRFAVFSFVR